MFNSNKNNTRPTDLRIKKPKTSDLSSLMENQVDITGSTDEKVFETPMMYSRYDQDAYNFTLESKLSSNRETSRVQGTFPKIHVF